MSDVQQENKSYNVPNDFVNLFKKHSRQAKKAVQSLHSQINMLQETVNNLVTEAVARGEHVRAEPFIPEYLGFTEIKIDNEDGTVSVCYYHPFNNTVLMRSGDDWCMTSTYANLDFKARNMYEAISLFDTLMYPISMDMYLMGELFVSKRPPWEAPQKQL
jgi:hypothetical protein